MDLPNLLNKLKSSTPPPHQFVAIEITSYAVKSAVWHVKGEQTEVVSIGSVQAWETNEDSDLLTALDLSLSDAYAGIEGEPNEVIFGLPETWVSDDTISEAKKPLVKTLCQKLALKPVGFVVSTEAIIHHLKDMEGGPPSAILINLSPQEIAVSLVYLGNLLGTQVVGRSQDLAADVEEGLARFPRRDSLPSRMILYDSRDDLEAAKQDLISHEWQAKLPFLHFPKIESLSKDVSIQAVAVAGGAEVARSLGLTAPSAPPVEEPEPPPPTPERPVPVVPEPAPAEPPTFRSLKANVDELGFQTVEVTPVATIRRTPPPAPLPTPNVVPAPDFAPPPAPVPVPVIPPPTHPHRFSFDRILRYPQRLLFVGQALKSRLKFSFHRPHLASPKKIRPVTLIGFGLALLAVCAVGGGLAYWYFPTAKITLFVTQRPLGKMVTFTLNPQSAEFNIGAATIPGTKEDVTVSGTKTINSTGTKTIGEKAKGKVVIYNRTNSPKNLPAGTPLKAGTLAFVSDTAVSIASASSQSNADFSITIQPAKAEVAVTAGQIGSQYNLPANTELTVQNYAKDSFIGTATTSLSGGYSQEVQVVSQADLQNVKTQLKQELEAQILSQVKQKTNGQQGAISTDDIETITEEYNHKANDEAAAVTLNMTMKEAVYVYNLDDVTGITEALIQNDIPAGYTVNAQDTQVSVTQTKINDDGTATITASINLMLVPKLDTQEIARIITGKYPSFVQNYFNSLPGYQKIEIVMNPSLPPRLSTLPRQTKNITVSVQAVSGP